MRGKPREPRAIGGDLIDEQLENGNDQSNTRIEGDDTLTQVPTFTNDPLTSVSLGEATPASPYTGRTVLNFWHTFKFYIGLLTTVLVFIAWTTNLVAKPLATAFGGTVTVVGMSIAYFTYARHKRDEHLQVAVTHSEEYLPGSL